MPFPLNPEVPTPELLERLAVLNRIARVMSDVTDLPGTLQQATRLAVRLFPERDIAVWLIDADGRRLVRASLVRHGACTVAEALSVVDDAGDRVLAQLRRGGQSISWNEDRGGTGSDFVDRLLGEDGYHCLTLVPLLARTGFMGVLMVGSDSRQSLCGTEELELAGAMAYQLAGAVEAALLLGELQQANTTLTQQTAFLQSVVDMAPGPMFVKDREGRIILANRAVAELYGKSPEQIIGCRDEDLGIPTEVADQWRAINRQVMADGGHHHHREQPIPTVPDGVRWFQTVIAPFHDLDGRIQGIIGALGDITERKQAHEALIQQKRFLQNVIDMAPSVLWVKDAEGRYLLINRSGAGIFGSTPEAMLGRSDHDTYLDRGMTDDWMEENRRVMETREPLLIPERMIPGIDGEPRWYRVAIAPFEDADGAVRGVIVSATEITERVLAERRLAEVNRELERLAQQDGLTGLANRRRLNRTLDQEWRRLRRLGGTLALAMVDVDHFKSYNDLHGHLAGDDCLRRVAETITGCLQRPADLAGRFGGEEFLLILPDTDRAGALAVAWAVNHAVAELAIAHPGSPLGKITASLGVAAMVPDEESPERLIQAADRALYRAKAQGRNRVAVAEDLD